MFSISGYKTREQLYESNQSLIFRAVREVDQLPVILKVLKDVHPTPERIARFKREHQLVKELELPGVVKVFDFSHAANHWLFVQEDFGGESLSRLGLAGRIDVSEFLALADTLVGHVAAIHQRAIIHKDLNPDNIVLERRSGTLKLIDFGISTRLTREVVAFNHLSLIEGTLAYLSPEQTGRIHQPLDLRTDLYAIGCTLYELLTGRPPFETTDPVELIHCHLARQPEPLHVRRSDVPPVLSDIINRLMAKNAADRYQSARGLQADLSRCRSQWREQMNVPSFSLGADDIASRLNPPARLYGRDAEIRELLAGFERVVGGAMELLMISGHSGVGKSALVKTLYRPVTRGRGFFVAGKFDQFQRNRPYGPVLDALDNLIGQILMEPPERMAEWAGSIQRAVTRMLPTLVKLLPRLELLLGSLPPIPELPKDETQRRFNSTLARLLRVFARAEHPVALFIDDLQWADSASLDLLKFLMTREPIAHLMVLGAYRHHEVGAAHPLRTALKSILSSGIEGHELHLESLDAEDTAALLADALHLDIQKVREPAGLLHDKTGGNPLFIQASLDALVAREILVFDHQAGTWQWHIERMRLLELSDNVVDLLLTRLQQLPAQTRDLIALASCIGSHFELGLLASTVNLPPHEVASALMPALVGNYLIPTSGDYRLLEAELEGSSARFDVTYKFAHDRIQQAAYSLVEPGEHTRAHLRIGRAMRAYFTGTAAETHFLATVNQLNQARELLVDTVERGEIAALNLEAGRKALTAVANAAALEYFELGLLLGAPFGLETSVDTEQARFPANLHAGVFQANPPLAKALTEGAAEAAYLLADFATMNQHVDALLRLVEGPLERSRALQIRVQAQIAQLQLAEAISSAREGLSSLGIELPVEPTEEDAETQIEQVITAMGKRSPIELASLPEMTALEPAVAMRALNSVFAAAFLTQPKLAPFLSASTVLLSLQHGFNEESIDGFLFFGMSLCGHDHATLGYEFGCLAEFLVEKYQRKSQLPNLALGGAYIFHWKRPLRDTIQKMRDGYRAGLETGNIGSAVNCLQGASVFGYFAGSNLAQIDEEYAESAQVLEKQKQGPYLTWLRQYHQAVRNLRGLNDNPSQLKGDVYDEVASLPIHEQTGDLSAVYMLHFSKLLLCYHFHDYRESLRCARIVEKGNQPGSVYSCLATLFQGLSLLALSSEVAADERLAFIAEAGSLTDRMKAWGEVCPLNYEHKYHLLAAELAHATGRGPEAREHFDLAIDLARKHEYIHEEGLALERAALYYLKCGNPRLAGYYLRDAYYAYGVWGATAKREFLRRHYGYLLDREDMGRNRSSLRMRDETETKSTTQTGEVSELDLATVLEATRAISRETELDRLLETVMRVSLENAGAERGFLLLARNDELIVKARGELGEERRFELISLSLRDQQGIARSVVQYVARTSQPVILDRAFEEGLFVNDPHIRGTSCRSLLCLPILNQGTLLGVSYLENNRAAAVFNESRVDILTLLMGQAAMCMENALLRAADQVRDFNFRVGGSLPIDSPSYVRRKADDLLAEGIREREFCYVFNARQMGKSSLRVRTVDRLDKAGFACVSIDLTAIGTRNVTAEQWYAGVARTLLSGLGLQADFDLRSWWRERADFSPMQRLEMMVDEVILARVDRPIVVFVDEVDAVLGLEFSSDDFFALIRLFYNRRAEDPRYERLMVVLLGVATPSDLIRDKRITPFNIGRAVPLAGFRFDESRNLLAGLSTAGHGERLLRAVLDWSGGQPFLTQKLCRLIVEAESRPAADKEREWVAELVQQRILDKWRHRDEPEHLKTIEARLLNAPLAASALLSLYQRILETGEVDVSSSPEESWLILSGIVVRSADKLRVANPIYAAVFNTAWIDTCLAAARGTRAGLTRDSGI